eukprot:Nk52_evm1s340 gene=Nk52_evmTU1s340
MIARTDVCNFSAGPAKMPQEVLEKAASEMLNWNGSGMSVMEMSHRSANFATIIDTAREDIKELLNVPDNYHILFLQGGASSQFAAVPMNFIQHGEEMVADYLITGTWSNKATKEAEKYGKINRVLPKNPSGKYDTIPDVSTWSLSPNASYVYYCENETVDGVVFDFIPETNGVPLICDMSSNILSKPVDVSKYGAIFAGAQKNIGPAGLTLVIVRDDLLGNQLPITPEMLNYKTLAVAKSLYNTPPSYSIYVAGLVFKWLKKKGGLKAIGAVNCEKSKKIFDVIDNSDGFYVSPVEKRYRSHMNVPFRIRNDEGLEKKFIQEAADLGMVELKGHRSVGGLRASIYNAMSLDDVSRFVSFMKDFMQKYQ